MTLAFRVHVGCCCPSTHRQRKAETKSLQRPPLTAILHVQFVWDESLDLLSPRGFNTDALLTYLSRPSVKNWTLRPMGHSYLGLFSEFWLFLYECFTRSSHKAFQVCHYQGRPLTVLFIVCQSINLPIIPTLFSQHWASFKFLSFLHCLLSAVFTLGFGGSQVIPTTAEQKKTIILPYFSVPNIDC